MHRSVNFFESSCSYKKRWSQIRIVELYTTSEIDVNQVKPAGKENWNFVGFLSFCFVTSNIPSTPATADCVSIFFI